MSAPVTTGSVPSDVPVEELAAYAESLRRDVLALENRLIAEIAAREALAARVQTLEDA